MRSLGFLLTRRWLAFAVVVALLASLAWWLGEWQFHRLADRQQRNAVIGRNVRADPVPVADVLAPGRAVPADREWTRVIATGSYDPSDTVVVRYRTRDGASGVDAVVPLQTAEGPALLVDRGWLPAGNSGAGDQQVPDPPSGSVTITGWVRVDATGDSTTVSDGSTRAVSSEAIGEALDREVYGGFVDLASETPPASEPLLPVELPEPGNGPHFFYGLQWWFFGVLAVVGFGYLAYDEWRGPTDAPRRREQVPRG